MFIKELILDGFKSYASRTVISGWDASFNAITGFNGTGKSNCLDAICFVLGITNLSQVRVQNLSELIYKQGQSRVSKASVTIVFDNSDRATSPIGMEEFSEITVTRIIQMGGKNKYLVNGHTCQVQRVQTLFQSVGLNVNNPHFLIMQGRIMKVCNMKPIELLAMIEEAAGTRMFETKKQAAQKTIAKKQQKVDEINKVLQEELQPTFDKLRNERATFHKFSSNKHIIDSLSNWFAAYNYWSLQKKLKENELEKDASDDDKRAKQQEMENIEIELEGLKRAHAELLKQKESELKNDLVEFEESMNHISKELVKVTSFWQNKKSNLDDENKELAKLKKQQVELDKNLKKKQDEMQQLAASLTALDTQNSNFTSQINTLRSAQLGISTSSADGEGGLTGQFMATQKKMAELESSIKNAESRLKHQEKEKKALESQLKELEKEGGSIEKEVSTKEAKLTAVQNELSNLVTDSSAQSQLEATLSKHESVYQQQEEEISVVQAKLNSRIKFEYNLDKKFDHKRIKGMVANLIQMKDVNSTQAIEVTAGGKLYNIIVDNEETGQILLEKGQLKKRVTIIPLNKIKGKTTEPAILNRAEALVGKENVNVALSLVCYASELTAAMTYIFGSTLVCSNGSQASKLAYHPEIRMRCVTVDGDTYDPSGTMEGGAAQQGGGILMQLHNLSQLKEKHDKLKVVIDDIKAKLNVIVSSEKKSEQLKRQYDLLKHELDLLKKRQSNSRYAQVKKEYDDHVSGDKEERTQLEANIALKKQLKSELEDLERSMKDFEGERTKKMKEMEKQLNNAQKQQLNFQKEFKAQQSGLERCKIEIQELESECTTVADNIKKIEESLVQLKREEQEAQLATELKRGEYDDASDKYNAEKARMAVHDKQLSKIQKEMSSLNKKYGELELDIKKQAHVYARLQQEHVEMKKQLLRLEEQFDWINSQKHQFGVAGSDYDFSAQDAKKKEAQFQALNEEQEQLSKKINKKVMGMFEKAEQEYDELMKKRTIIENDKAKIEEVISELDRKKQETLDQAWRKVTKDFNAIFSALLPGVRAKLEPPEGCDVSEGLEMRVAFGEVWKDSLSELSGGQRSLLALSLILALLLFKPAPMYILDEIDAALDLSHTQNIGQMLKKHFPQSQFIVVSLKEGMFNNANVIFRTKFVDGVSTVIRTALKQNDRK